MGNGRFDIGSTRSTREVRARSKAVAATAEQSRGGAIRLPLQLDDSACASWRLCRTGKAQGAGLPVEHVGVAHGVDAQAPPFCR